MLTRGGGSCSKLGAQFITEAQFRVRKTIIFFTSGPNIGLTNAHLFALGSAAPAYVRLLNKPYEN